jgi:predicted Fe-Mo cluster-binding NifX family protein
MKVAVTTEGNRLTSRVAPRLSRAKWLEVVDTETGQVAFHANRPANGNGARAALKTAFKLLDLGVDTVVTGSIGMDACHTLRAAGIRVSPGHAGTAQEAVERLKAGHHDPYRPVRSEMNRRVCGRPAGHRGDGDRPAGLGGAERPAPDERHPAVPLRDARRGDPRGVSPGR